MSTQVPGRVHLPPHEGIPGPFGIPRQGSPFRREWAVGLLAVLRLARRAAGGTATRVLLTSGPQITSTKATESKRCRRPNHPTKIAVYHGGDKRPNSFGLFSSPAYQQEKSCIIRPTRRYVINTRT